MIIICVFTTLSLFQHAPHDLIMEKKEFDLRRCRRATTSATS